METVEGRSGWERICVEALAGGLALPFIGRASIASFLVGTIGLHEIRRGGAAAPSDSGSPLRPTPVPLLAVTGSWQAGWRCGPSGSQS